MLEGVIKAIKNCGDVVIAGHTNPDGDAVGASLGLGLALKKLGKNVRVVLEEYNARFNIIPGRGLLYNAGARLDPDTFIALDCGSRERLGAASVLLSAANTVNIDHHINNTCFAAINLLEPSASSTCEIVFRVLDKMDLMDADIAGALYAGIVYDTGGFRHDSTSLDTMAAVKKLMGFGIPFSLIYNELMHSHSLAEAKIMGRAISHLELYDGNIAFTYITKADLADTAACASDLGGICEYALNTAGAESAVFVYEKDDSYKISLRSKSMPVNTIAEHFGGGGHRLAAGCDFKGTLEQAKDGVIHMIRQSL